MSVSYFVFCSFKVFSCSFLPSKLDPLIIHFIFKRILKLPSLENNILVIQHVITICLFYDIGCYNPFLLFFKVYVFRNVLILFPYRFLYTLLVNSYCFQNVFSCFILFDVFYLLN